MFVKMLKLSICYLIKVVKLNLKIWKITNKNMEQKMFINRSAC